MLARASKRDNVKSADQDKFHNKCKSPNVLSGKEASFNMSLFIRSMPPSSEYDEFRMRKLIERRDGRLQRGRNELEEGDSDSMDKVCRESEAICSPGGLARYSSRKEGVLCRTKFRPTGVQQVKARLSSCFNSDK